MRSIFEQNNNFVGTCATRNHLSNVIFIPFTLIVTICQNSLKCEPCSMICNTAKNGDLKIETIEKKYFEN